MSQQTACGKETRSSPALNVDYQLWGWLLPTPKHPAGALRVTKTYPGSHRASTNGHPCLASTSAPAEFTKHLLQLQALCHLPSASSRRLRSMQNGHELIRPCPRKDMRYIIPASPTCVSVLWVAWLGIPEHHGMNSSPRNTCGCSIFKT